MWQCVIHFTWWRFSTCDSFIHLVYCLPLGRANSHNTNVCEWVKENFNSQICAETAWRWIHHLGFSMCSHQKGIYILWWPRVWRHSGIPEWLFAMFDETTITSSQPRPSVADGEQWFIRVVHDESTFYANANQTRFWNDGQAQVLLQKSLNSSIMVSDFFGWRESIS